MPKCLKSRSRTPSAISVEYRFCGPEEVHLVSQASPLRTTQTPATSVARKNATPAVTSTPLTEGFTDMMTPTPTGDTR